MTQQPVLRQRSGPACATLVLLGIAASAAGADTFNAATGHLTIPTLTIGNATYSNVIVTIGTLLEPPAGTVPAFPADSYFPGSNELTVQTVGVVGGQTYDNVVVTVAALDSVGNAAGVDTYHNGILTLPEVQAGSAIYTNVTLAVGAAAVAGVAGGMPKTFRDQYSAGQLLIPAVQVGSTVYTNVTVNIVPANIVSAGPIRPPETPLFSFGTYYPDGGTPNSGLAEGSDGNFYGTTAGGGSFDAGTVFCITPSGKETLVHQFATGTVNDGASPLGGIVAGRDGNFYGATQFGGTNGLGTVFQADASGTVRIVYSFGAVNGDAVEPIGTVIRGKDGNIYGTTKVGGAHGLGTLFQVTPAGAERVVYSFGANAADAAQPTDGVIQGSDGNFYGITHQGGQNGTGAVFGVSPDGAETVLYSADRSSVTNGITLLSTLVDGNDGYLYVDDYGGGAHGGGAFLRLGKTGGVTVLYSFGGTAGDGARPTGSLIRASDGNFYGTTQSGGAYSSGTVFRITPTGQETVVYSFGAAMGDGNTPSSLIQGSDGNIYGTTTSGGTQGIGTFFMLPRP
jgi:uncharacterized repeat protein (TIGR03803 family)